jgi:SAM-dependent methyltransferase
MSAAIHFESSPAFQALLGEVVVQSACYPREQVARTALELLDLAPDDAVLEIGCGSGDILARAAARVPRGFAAGLDPSELMVRHARFRNRRWIARGRVEVRHAHSADLSAYADGRFDCVLGVHVVYFWSDPRPHLAEVRRVLRRGGRLVLGFRPGDGGDPAGHGPNVSLPTARVEGWLRKHGFEDVERLCKGDPRRPLAWLRASNARERS